MSGGLGDFQMVDIFKFKRFWQCYIVIYVTDLLVPGHHLRPKKKTQCFGDWICLSRPVERQKEGVPVLLGVSQTSVWSGHTREGSLTTTIHWKKRNRSSLKNIVGFWPEVVDIVQKINPLGRPLTFHEIRQQFHLLSTKFMWFLST